MDQNTICKPSQADGREAAGAVGVVSDRAGSGRETAGAGVAESARGDVAAEGAAGVVGGENGELSRRERGEPVRAREDYRPTGVTGGTR